MRTFAVLALLALVALAVATESETPVENTNQAPEMAMSEAPAAVSQATAEKTTDNTESLTQVGWRRRRRRRRRRYIRRRRWIGSAGERNAKNAERSNKERANKERSNKARERANKERSSKARERSAKERAGKAARERSAKERRAKAVARERYNKVVERRNKNASRERRNKAIARERKAKRIATEKRGKESRAKKAIEARNKRERSGKAREKSAKRSIANRERKAKKAAREKGAKEANAKRARAAKIRREKNGKEKKGKAKAVELKKKRTAAVAKYKEDTAKKRKKKAAAVEKKGKVANKKLQQERVGKRRKESGQKVRKRSRELKKKAHKRSAKKAKTTLKKLKKGGATNADCVDLANTMCKTVEKEVSTDQRLLDRLKDGKHCVNLGLKAVRTATAHLVKTRRIRGQWKVKVTSSYNARINFGYHTFSSLKEGKCGQFFTSRSYRTASHRYRRNVKIEASWRGRVKEATRVLVQVKLSRKRQVKRCHCATKKARYLLWSTVTKRSRMSRQIKAHAKCKMLKCVLKGTPLKSRKCRASLKRLRNKKLISATERVRGCGKTTRKTGFKRRVVTKKKPSHPRCAAKSFVHYACSKCGSSGTGGTIATLRCPKKCGWGRWTNVRSSGASSIRLDSCGKSAQLQVAYSTNGRRAHRYIYKSNYRGARVLRKWNVPKNSVVWNCGRLPNGGRTGGCLPTGNDNIRSMRFRCC